MDAHSVWMELEAVGQLLGPGRAAQLAEQAEQACARRLGKHIVWPRGDIHGLRKFCTAAVWKTAPDVSVVIFSQRYCEKDWCLFGGFEWPT